MQVHIDGLVARHPAARANAPAALQGVSLGIKAGEHVAVIGPSGAGKTSLLHVLACALKPSAGSLRLRGDDPWTLKPKALRELRSSLFLAPQVPPLPPRQRVVTSVLAGRLPHWDLLHSLRSLFVPRDLAAAQAALAQFDLSDKLFERVDRLSGGERQRVALSRLLLADASLWLIDEPLSALDPTRAGQAMSTLVNAATKRQASLVCSLHQVDRALAHFARIVGLRNGAVAFDLPAASVSRAHLQALYAQHEHELTGTAIEGDELPQPAAPAVMHCR